MPASHTNKGTSNNSNLTVSRSVCCKKKKKNHLPTRNALTKRETLNNELLSWTWTLKGRQREREGETRREKGRGDKVSQLCAYKY